MANRRNFMRSVGGAIGGVAAVASLAYPSLNALKAEAANYDDNADISRQNDFWGWVRSSFSIAPGVINLNNGGVSPHPRVVQDALFQYDKMVNDAPSYYMWRILDQNREPLRRELANLAGCDTEEIAINRNATEGLNSIIFGLNLKKGDEVVLTKQDYPNMINAWKQREKRDGVVLRWVDLDLPIEDDDYAVSKFAEQITSKTKVVHITHIINWTGQILPARKIADVAKKVDADVIVDGAHTFAHLDYNIPDLNCDYFATSLHKWLCAPLGSGLLYIKKDKIKDVWALLSANEPDGSDIRKFESLGTRSFPSEMAIASALDFHNVITTKRKQQRLHFLKHYWLDQVKDMRGVYLNTSLKPQFSGALSNFGIEGMEPSEIENELFNKHKIHTVAIVWENIKGVRVTPNIYTSTRDLDILVDGIKKITSKI